MREIERGRGRDREQEIQRIEERDWAIVREIKDEGRRERLTER